MLIKFASHTCAVVVSFQKRRRNLSVAAFRVNFEEAKSENKKLFLVNL